MPENQAVLFWGLILGVLRILLFQGRAESPMERVAQGKRSGTLGWVIVSKTIYALKGQKRGYCAFVSHTQCLLGFQPEFFKLSRSAMFLRFCPFRAWIFYFCLTYPGCRFACPGLSAPLGFQPAQDATSLALLCATLGFQSAFGKVKSVVHLNSIQKKNRLIFRHES